MVLKIAQPEPDLSPLTIDIETLAPEGGTLVRLSGRIDVFNYAELSNRLHSLIEGTKGMQVALDLSQATFVASSGWATLMAASKQLLRQGGALVIIGMQGDVERTFQTLKMPSLIPRVAGLKEAVEFFARATPKPPTN